MKRALLALTLALGLVFSVGCGPREPELRRFEASFLNLFDTVTTVVGYAQTEEEFRADAQRFHDRLLEYHQLYDIYNTYEGVNNICTINQNAGGSPVEVDGRIIDLLLFAQEVARETGGKVDVTYGPVLALWHDAREAGVNDPQAARLPDSEALKAAEGHVGFDRVEIDREQSTVRLSDPEARLDVGALAKGYAVEMVCRASPSGLLVSVGGNVRATGPRASDGSDWVVGIQDPDGGEEYLHTLYLNTGAVVTSGDYQRCYTVDGKRYHHIIDPDTRFPGEKWRAVTVLCEDSGVADGLSTALFLMDREEGTALLEQYDAQAMWIDPQGEAFYSEGFMARVRT